MKFYKGHFLALDISVPHQKGTFLLLIRCLFDMVQNKKKQGKRLLHFLCAISKGKNTFKDVLFKMAFECMWYFCKFPNELSSTFCKVD